MSSVNQGAGSYVSRAEQGGSVALPTGYVHRVIPAWASNSTVSIGVGACRSDDDTEDIVVSSPLTVYITATGANGRNVDTAEQANKWYAVCVIKNPATGAVAGFLINEDNLGAFTYPAGYTKKRRVGWIRNNNSSNLRNGKYFGCGGSRKWQYDTERTEMLALSGGSATVFTDINLAQWVPPSQIGVEITGVYDPFGTSFCDFRPNGSSVADPVFFTYQSTAAESFQIEMYTDSSRIIEYQCFNAADSIDIYVMGFFDDLDV